MSSLQFFLADTLPTEARPFRRQARPLPRSSLAYRDTLQSEGLWNTSAAIATTSRGKAPPQGKPLQPAP
jgi:hypothetical protein